MADAPKDSPNRGSVAIPSLKSIFIEARFGSSVLGTATAFLIASDRQSHCALITNRHVVTGRHQETGRCLNSNAGIPDNLVIHFHAQSDDADECKWNEVQLPLFRQDGSPYWFEHSKFGERADVVALNLHWGNDVVKFPYYLETDLDRFGIALGPAESVSVVGFPLGRSVERFPIWATGFLAQDWSLVTPESPTFLIDCRTREGQSGSPVLAYRVGSYRHQKGDKIVSTLSPHPVWEFLGIYSGRISRDSDLGIAWHHSVVADVLSVAAADAQRRERTLNKEPINGGTDGVQLPASDKREST